MLRNAILAAIARYRATGGGLRWFGVDCNFEPTCSAYTYDAVARYGVRRGLALARNRIRRCRARDSVCKCLEPLPDDVEATRG